MKKILFCLILTSCTGVQVFQPTMTESEMRKEYPEQYREQDKKECVKKGYDAQQCEEIFGK